jgi:hypothetical protein
MKACSHATTLEQVRVTTGSKHSHSVEPNLMNSEILKKNWEPEEIRESQLNDNSFFLIPIQLIFKMLYLN